MLELKCQENARAIAQQIKTSGGGGASGINYSTDEQDTGLKWIDEKPIYQKTVTTLSVEIAQANTFVSTGISATGIDSLIDAIMIDVNDQIMCGMVGFVSSKAYVGVTSAMADRTLKTITIWYTKESEA